MRRGEIFGYLGPNGAGKTTTIKILCGLLRRDAGLVSGGGADIEIDPVLAKQRIGVKFKVGADFCLFAFCTVQDEPDKEGSARSPIIWVALLVRETRMDFSLKRFWLVVAVTALCIALSSGVGTAQEKNYQALSLEDCLSLARQYNPVLAASREKIQELVADYQAAR